MPYRRGVRRLSRKRPPKDTPIRRAAYWMTSLQDDPPANLLNDLFGRVTDRDEIVHLGSPYVAPGNHCAADPVEEAVPEGTLVQDNGKRTDTFGLREHKCFGEFVNGAHAAGHDDIRERILYKHELAQEEVAYCILVRGEAGYAGRRTFLRPR